MRQLAKTAATAVCILLAVPYWLYYGFWRLLVGRERAFVALGQALASRPGLLGQYVRAAALRPLAGRIGKDVVLSFGSVLTKSSAELGNGVYVGSYCLLGDVRVGDNTLIADHVCIPSGPSQHGIGRLDVPIRRQDGQLQTVRIGQDCWIGSGAVVLADIADHCVVAAASVVTHPTQEYQIVAGNPARAIADRREKARQTGGATQTACCTRADGVAQNVSGTQAGDGRGASGEGTGPDNTLPGGPDPAPQEPPRP